MKEFFIVITLIGFAFFLILLVLVQRGRGGGLAGALGGAGGQSAFGAKAGDTFTKITMWTAFFWIVFCVIAVRLMTESGEPDFSSSLGGSAQTESGQQGQQGNLNGQGKTETPTESVPSDTSSETLGSSDAAPASSTGETESEETPPVTTDSNRE